MFTWMCLCRTTVASTTTSTHTHTHTYTYKWYIVGKVHCGENLCIVVGGCWENTHSLLCVKWLTIPAGSWVVLFSMLLDVDNWSEVQSKEQTRCHSHHSSTKHRHTHTHTHTHTYRHRLSNAYPFRPLFAACLPPDLEPNILHVF